MEKRPQHVRNEQSPDNVIKETEFKFKTVKYEFVTKCINYVKENRLEEIWPCTYEQLSKTKEHVLEGKDLLLQSGPESLLFIHKRLLQRYDVINRILVTNHRKRVIDVFLLFDIIYQAHVSKEHHCDFQKTQAALNPMYYVPKQAVDFFLTVCNVCQLKPNMLMPKNQQLNTATTSRLLPQCSSPGDTAVGTLPIANLSKPETTLTCLSEKNADSKVKLGKIVVLANKNVFVNVIEMDDYDGDFKHLLIYMDTFTKYTLLRPLVKLDDVMEIAIVLFKIFADFGVPSEMFTLVNYFSFLQEALNLLDLHFSLRNVRLSRVSIQEIREKSSDINFIARKVKNRLDKWSVVTKSGNWAMGCYMVQIKMNQEKTGTNSISPFEALFNKDYAKIVDRTTSTTTQNVEFESSIKLGTKQFETEENRRKSKNCAEDVHVISDSSSDGYIPLDDEEIETENIPLDDEEMEIEEKPDANQDYCIDTENQKTTGIVHENEDSLDAFRDEQAVSNSLPNKPVSKNKNVTHTQYEKSFETFTKVFMDVNKSVSKYRCRKQSYPIDSSDSSSENEEEKTAPIAYVIVRPPV